MVILLPGLRWMQDEDVDLNHLIHTTNQIRTKVANARKSKAHIQLVADL